MVGLDAIGLGGGRLRGQDMQRAHRALASDARHRRRPGRGRHRAASAAGSRMRERIAGVAPGRRAAGGVGDRHRRIANQHSRGARAKGRPCVVGSRRVRSRRLPRVPRRPVRRDRCRWCPTPDPWRHKHAGAQDRRGSPGGRRLHLQHAVRLLLQPNIRCRETYAARGPFAGG